MIESHKNRANIFIIIGLIMSIGANIWSRSLPPGDSMIAVALVISIIGTVVFVFGCMEYAQAKGRSRWWGLFGLLSLIGLLVLVLLKDHSDMRRPQGFPVQPRRPMR